MSDQLVLFKNTVNSSLSDYLNDIFVQWLDKRQSSIRPLRKSSIDVYTAMWQSISRFFIGRQLDPLSASTADIAALLSYAGGSLIYHKRLIRLFEEVTRSATGADFVSPVHEFMKQARYRFADSRSGQKVPLTLNRVQEHELIKKLLSPRTEGNWKRLRDVAMAATILSSGVKPGEVLALTNDQVRYAGMNSANGELPEKFTLPGNGNNGPRECPIAPWGQQIFGDWLLTRKRLGIATKYIFPCGLGADRPVAKSTFYRQFAKFLEDAGIVTPKSGSHILRHTYAVRQLENGKSDQLVQDWLGLEDFLSMEGYRKVARS